MVPGSWEIAMDDCRVPGLSQLSSESRVNHRITVTLRLGNTCSRLR
jgi:hypothetical protein